MSDLVHPAPDHSKRMAAPEGLDQLNFTQQ